MESTAYCTQSEKQNSCLGTEWLLRVWGVSCPDGVADWEHLRKAPWDYPGGPGAEIPGFLSTRARV